MEENQKKQEVKLSNTLVNTLSLITLVLIGYIAYIYSSNDIVKKGQLNDQYVLKTDMKFSMLPSYEKSRYIEYFEYDKKITELNKQLQYAQNNKNSANPSVVEKIVKVDKIVEKIVEIEKIVEVEKIINVPMDMRDEFAIVKEIKKSNLTFNTYTCKTMDSGGIRISKKCKKALYKFLDKNKNSKIYEVIGIVDNKDFKLINTLKDVYGEKRIKHLSKYSQLGLSRQRVIEASWLVKKYLGNYKNIKTVNYTVNAKDKKGFVVRAYK